MRYAGRANHTDAASHPYSDGTTLMSGRRVSAWPRSVSQTPAICRSSTRVQSIIRPNRGLGASAWRSATVTGWASLGNASYRATASAAESMTANTASRCGNSCVWWWPMIRCGISLMHHFVHADRRGMGRHFPGTGVAGAVQSPPSGLFM